MIYLKLGIYVTLDVSENLFLQVRLRDGRHMLQMLPEPDDWDSYVVHCNRRVHATEVSDGERVAVGSKSYFIRTREISPGQEDDADFEMWLEFDSDLPKFSCMLIDPVTRADIGPVQCHAESVHEAKDRIAEMAPAYQVSEAVRVWP